MVTSSAARNSAEHSANMISVVSSLVRPASGGSVLGWTPPGGGDAVLPFGETLFCPSAPVAGTSVLTFCGDWLWFAPCSCLILGDESVVVAFVGSLVAASARHVRLRAACRKCPTLRHGP
ncbi:hypothetical protein PG987_007848 [Apiospora arundinis]